MIIKYFLSILHILLSHFVFAFIFFIMGIGTASFLFLDKDHHDDLTQMLKENEKIKVMEFDHQFTKEKIEIIYGEKIEKCYEKNELTTFYYTPFSSLEAYLDKNNKIKICSIENFKR